MKIELTREEAKLIVKYLSSSWVMPDEQRVVYNFIRKLESLIENEKDVDK